MNLDHHGTKRRSIFIRPLETSDDSRNFDSDDLTVIRKALLEAADNASIPQHAMPLTKLADLITEALKP